MAKHPPGPRFLGNRHGVRACEHHHAVEDTHPHSDFGILHIDIMSCAHTLVLRQAKNVGMEKYIVTLQAEEIEQLRAFVAKGKHSAQK